jgi:hypothetical protein
MPGMKNLTAIVAGALFAGLGLVAGCQSSVVPLRPIERIEVWEPMTVTTVAADAPEAAAATEAATQSATQAATSAATPATTRAAGAVSTTEPATQASTQPATRPGRKVIKIIDPNQTLRFVYKANYDRVWEQALQILAKTGFILDRQDYRLGVLTTRTLPSSQIVEFWKPQQTDSSSAWENTINTQRRMVRITIAKVPHKPEFYEIAIQVLVERETNPSEVLGGPLFAEGSGFGRAAVSLGSDYAPPVPEKEIWIRIGHDPKLEKKLLDLLFDKI